jgi:hypothetical protein
LATTTSSSKQLQQSQFSTPQEALTPIVGNGAQMVYDAKWALQQIRDNVSGTDPGELLQIVEPLARSIGWVEALVFAQTTDGPGVAQQFGNGGQQGRN